MSLARSVNIYSLVLVVTFILPLMGVFSVSSCGWVLQQTDRSGACADSLAYSTRWNARFLTDGSASWTAIA